MRLKTFYKHACVLLLALEDQIAKLLQKRHYRVFSILQLKYNPMMPKIKFIQFTYKVDSFETMNYSKK